jgi:hypothetical protein
VAARAFPTGAPSNSIHLRLETMGVSIDGRSRPIGAHASGPPGRRTRARLRTLKAGRLSQGQRGPAYSWTSTLLGRVSRPIRAREFRVRARGSPAGRLNTRLMCGRRTVFGQTCICFMINKSRASHISNFLGMNVATPGVRGSTAGSA